MDAKALKKLILTLTPPRYMVWITADKRRQAADALGKSKSSDAVPPLAAALADSVVRDSALLALDSLPISPKHAAVVLTALGDYRKDIRKRFMDEYLHPERNANMMKLVPESGKTGMRSEPESFLGAALTMARSISSEKADKIARCEQKGLVPYSRKHFIENVRLLSREGVFPFWPAMDFVDTLMRTADGLVEKIAQKHGGKVPAHADETPAGKQEVREEEHPGAGPEQLRAFAKKSLGRHSSITVPMRDVGAVIAAVAGEIAAAYPGLDRAEIFRLLTSSVIRLKCFHCGPLPAQYTQQVLQTVQEALARGEAPDTGRMVGAGGFATGHGPDCTGAAVEVGVEPEALSLPAANARKAGEGKEGGETTLYDVVFAGEYMQGMALSDVKEALAALYKVSPEKIEAFFTGGPRFVQKGVSREKAEKAAGAFHNAGALCRIVPSREGEAGS
jgi:hypothetical protein